MAKRKSKGLGDTIEKVTTATGIKAAVKFLAGDDCGCDERKEKLNQLFPYKKANCLNETDYNYLHSFFTENANTLPPKVQRELSAIYFNIFGSNLQSGCDDCWRDYVAQLRVIYNEYK